MPNHQTEINETVMRIMWVAELLSKKYRLIWAFEDLFRTFREEITPHHVIPPIYRLSSVRKHATLFDPSLALAFAGNGESLPSLPAP